jgi:hypothetical protein
VGLSPLGTAATSGLLYKPQMIDDGDYGEIGGMKIGRGNRSTRRKPDPAPFCPPQTPHDQTRARTRAAAVGSQRLTAWAMARPSTLNLRERAIITHWMKAGSAPEPVCTRWQPEKSPSPLGVEPRFSDQRALCRRDIKYSPYKTVLQISCRWQSSLYVV